MATQTVVVRKSPRRMAHNNLFEWRQIGSHKAWYPINLTNIIAISKFKNLMLHNRHVRHFWNQLLLGGAVQTTASYSKYTKALIVDVDKIKVLVEVSQLG